MNKSFTKKAQSHPRIALIGQPNCGKSTIFNSVAGYRSISTNFPGATVEYTLSHISVQNETCDLVDLPGIYSLIALERAAEESKKYLLEQKIDVLINVMDASILSRSLELTLQLIELGLPMIICLNMMDEAARKGIQIDPQKLADKLGVQVVTTIGSKGQGVDELFDTALQTIYKPHPSNRIPMSRHVEKKVEDVHSFLVDFHIEPVHNNYRLTAIKLLEKDPYCIDKIPAKPGLFEKIEKIRQELKDEHGQSADSVIAAERHHAAMMIFEQVAVVSRSHKHRSWMDQLDNILMHPVLGIISMLAILLVFFNAIFKFGALIEGPLMNLLNTGISTLLQGMPAEGFMYQIIFASLQGIAGGIAIVLPYLLPFLIALAFIEDIGYLPRIAFLLDSFMHRIGLHGVAVIPGILGYGCSVPAIMATRILSSPRDRFIATIVSVLVPCAARMTIIMGLVGYYMGGTAVFGIYILNIIVISLLGALLAKLMPEDVPGMILEMPAYHMPKLEVILAKTWLRLKDFIVLAWPLLIVGSLVLGLAEWYEWDKIINDILSPLTRLLDLPPQVGTTLIFGILRKELSMLMLFQALGTTDIHTVMSMTQILVYTLFVVFYVPCLATLGIMGKEVGWKKTLLATGITIIIAILIGLAGRLFGTIFL